MEIKERNAKIELYRRRFELLKAALIEVPQEAHWQLRSNNQTNHPI